MFYIYADGQMIYHLANPDLYLVKPTLDMELGKAGSLEFGILPDHFAYDKLPQMRTMITVDYDNTEIFRGRVLSNKRNFDNSRTIYCEGDLAFLVDSVQKCEKYSGTTHALFQKIIAAHNARVEPYKQFTVGNVTIENRPIELVGQSEENINVGNIDYKQIAIDSIAGEWNNTYDFIETCLIDYCGGYLKTRRENNVTYIDYVESYVDTCTQPVSIGLNVLDLEEEITAEDLFTVLVPIGTDNITVASVNNGSDELVDANAVEQYGRIIQTHVFNNVTSPSTLKENGLRYLQEHIEAQRTLTVKAIDLHMFNKDIMQIKLGSRVTITSTPHSINEALTCTEIEYDFEDPSQTQYTFGSQHQSLTQRYREDKRKESDLYGNSGGGGGKSSAGGGIKGWHIRDANGNMGDKQQEEEEKKIQEFFNAYIATDPEHADITLDAVYRRVENSIEILKSQCGIYIDADPEQSNVNIKTLYNKVNENTGAIANTRTVIDQVSNETQANISIVAQATNRNSSDISENKTAIASLRVTANTHGDSIIALNADVIELNGRIKTLEADDIFANRVVTAISRASLITASYIQATTLKGTSTIISPLIYMGDELVTTKTHYHTLSASGGVVTLGASTTDGPTSFNIADTQFYKDGVSAAKTAAAQTATLQNLSVASAGSPYNAYGAKYADVDITTVVSAEKGDGSLYSDTKTTTKAVNVTTVYNAGVDEGESHFTPTTVYLLGSSTTKYDDGGSVSGTNLGSEYPNKLYVENGSGGYRRLWTSLYYAGSSYSYRLRGSSGRYYNSGGAATYYEKTS